MIFDCHAHLPHASLEDFLRRASRWGIEATCMFALGNEIDPKHPAPKGSWPSCGAPHQTDSLAPPPERISPSNDLVVQLMERAKGAICGFCFVNPRHPEHALREIRRCVAEGPMRGIKLWVACKASDPLVEPIASAAIELDVPLLQHCWLKYGGNLEHESTPMDVAMLAARFPQLKIIAAHLSGQQEEGICALARHSNVYFDTSGMAADAGILEFALDRVGAGRILFGSDAPLRDPGRALARTNGTPMSTSDREAILGKNFARLIQWA